MNHAEQVQRFAGAGCKFIQIREKRMPSRDLFDEILATIVIAKEFGMKVIVNDRVDIAMAAGADGVHLGQDDLSPEQARQLLGGGAIIGYSTHSIEQAIAAAAMPIDYIAIGPIFSTDTKENPDPVVGLKGIREVRGAIGRFPLVAIGGINRENLADVLAAGADSAALISELYRDAADIAERFSELSDIASTV